MNREGVISLECVSLQRSLEQIGQHLGVLSVWPSFHLKCLDMMEGISGLVIFPEIQWAIGWQDDSWQIIKGITDQSTLWLG